ncbi:MAG: hypothetical protein IJW28_05675 [Clostridia bacterium]|nr:hypothetical protein [Clostridia bacterium]
MSKNTNLYNDLYKNVRMATYGIDCIIDAIENKKLKDVISKQNKVYLDYTKELENMSKELDVEVVDLNPLLKASSFTSIKMKTLMNNEKNHLCEMLIQGTTMGITTILIAIAENKDADIRLKEIANNIRKSQENFVDSLKDIILL